MGANVIPADLGLVAARTMGLDIESIRVFDIPLTWDRMERLLTQTADALHGLPPHTIDALIGAAS